MGNPGRSKTFHGIWTCSNPALYCNYIQGYGRFSGPSGEAGLPCILYVRTFVHHERDVLPRSMKIIVPLTDVRQRAGASIYWLVKQWKIPWKENMLLTKSVTMCRRSPIRSSRQAKIETEIFWFSCCAVYREGISFRKLLLSALNKIPSLVEIPSQPEWGV